MPLKILYLVVCLCYSSSKKKIEIQTSLIKMRIDLVFFFFFFFLLLLGLFFFYIRNKYMVKCLKKTKKKKKLPCDALIDIKNYLGQCDSVLPIFHRSVILPNNWKTI